jgi:hypothetical protein
VARDPATPLHRQRDPLAADEDRLGLLARRRLAVGYTAISRELLEQLDLERIYRRYGFPNDMLVHLNVWNARVRDIPARPVYGVGSARGSRSVASSRASRGLLLKGFLWRLREKYVIRDFHPLVFFYTLGFVMTFVGLALGLSRPCCASPVTQCP